jgi:hypothetical protein
MNIWGNDLPELVDIAARGRISRTRQNLIEATTNDVIPAKQRWSQLQQINSDLCKSFVMARLTGAIKDQ